MLSKCVQCGFNIRHDDEFCLNCGIYEPTENYQPEIQQYLPLLKLLKSNNFKTFLSIFLTFFLLLIFAEFSFRGMFQLGIYIYSLTLFLAFVVTFGGTYFLSDLLTVKERKRFKNKNNLASQEKIIKNRTNELKQKTSQMEMIFERIGESPSLNLQSIQNKLLPVREIIDTQLIKYNFHTKKIELVRLQNEVLPYLEKVDFLKDYETENGIVTAENTMRGVADIAQNLSERFPAEFEKEKQVFLQQLQETSNSCEKLREVLVSKQALRALQAVQPIEDICVLPNSNEISHSTETFNIQMSLTDFSESFEQLEKEYQRLLAESEINPKLLNFEN